MPHCDNECSAYKVLHDYQFSMENLSTSRSSDNQYIDSCQMKKGTEKEVLLCSNAIGVGKINGRLSNTVTRPVSLSPKEYTSRHSVYTSYSDLTTKSKKNVSVQTSNRNKSSRKRSKKRVGLVSIDSSPAKDIKTIFTTNRADFNSGKSKTNVEIFETRYMKEVRRRNEIRNRKEASKRWKMYDKVHPNNSIDAKERVSQLENGDSANVDNDKRKFVKNKRIGKQYSTSEKVRNCTRKDSTTIYRKSNVKARDRSLTLNDDENNDSRIRNSNESYVKGRGKIVIENSLVIKSNASSFESLDTSWESRNYLLEDKTSELMILGNVKKRLEEDYDDYFSLNDVDLENDLFLDATSAIDISETNQLHDNPKTSESMVTSASVRKQHRMKELRKQLIRTNLTCTSSVRFANSDLCHEQSSYHTSLRDHECSQSSSIEYCTASSVSLTKLESSHSNSFNRLSETYSIDTGIAYDGRVKISNKKNELSNDTLLESDAFKDTREFLDRALVNSFTVCCYQRNSTPNFTNSSKLITESLDSGILTDCSRDHLRTISKERFRHKTVKKSAGERKCWAREVDLLTTCEFNTDSSCSDDSLNRRVDIAVKKFTENLILTERRARTKLRRMENPGRRRHERKRRKNNSQQVNKVSECILKRSSACKYESSPRLNVDDDWIVSSSTPPLFSFSDSEMDHL
ncbi:unnamed protein product [Xylocopa violacea]|uniref:Uncharacterized protein n=1 Tax=Xylocopa violacea TaxID=135666 RepID=A0ABP1P9A4_XYLVO